MISEGSGCKFELKGFLAWSQTIPANRFAKRTLMSEVSLPDADAKGDAHSEQGYGSLFALACSKKAKGAFLLVFL